MPLLIVYAVGWLFAFKNPCDAETLFYFGRSHKEKRSSYAPEVGVRYDGIYRIEKCWRKVGVQVYFMCDEYVALVQYPSSFYSGRTYFAVQLILFSFCHRVSRYAGIFLFGVIMNLHHGQGLAYVMSFFQYHKLLLLLFYDLTLFKSSDDHGDRPRPLPVIKELKNAADVTERKESPAWNYDVCVCSLSFAGV